MIPEFNSHDFAVVRNQLIQLVKTPIEENFERIINVAKNVFHTPIVAINLFDERRYSIQSAAGFELLDDPQRSHLFEQDYGQEILIVEDTLRDPDFQQDSLILLNPQVRFFAACPIIEKTGRKVGALMLADMKPKKFDVMDLSNLQDIVHLVETEVNSYQLSIAQKLMLQELSAQQQAEMIDPETRLWNYQGFMRQVDYQIDESLKNYSCFGVAAIDIDNLCLSPNQQQTLIRDLASKLVSSCRDRDVIALGDECLFMVLINSGELENILTVAKRIMNNLNSVVANKSSLIHEVSIGLSLFEPASENHTQLLKDCLCSLQQAKKSNTDKLKIKG